MGNGSPLCHYSHMALVRCTVDHREVCFSLYLFVCVFPTPVRPPRGAIVIVREAAHTLCSMCFVVARRYCAGVLL